MNVTDGVENPIQIIGEQAMLEFGARLAPGLGDSCLITLCGELGSGKTTIARGVLRGLGFEGRVKSPTYTLVEPYECAGKSIYHFDFYRIEDAEELELAGIPELLTLSAIRIVEWPSLGGAHVPAADLAISIELIENGRLVHLRHMTREHLND